MGFSRCAAQVSACLYCSSCTGQLVAGHHSGLVSPKCNSLAPNFRTVGIKSYSFLLFLKYDCSVGRTFHSMFEDRCRNPDPVLNSASLEYIPIDFHVPILDISGLPSLSMNRTLSNAVIQGSFELARRDYSRIFDELLKSLHGAYISLYRIVPKASIFFLYRISRNMGLFTSR